LQTKGVHLLAEYHGCAEALLDDPVALEALLREAAAAAGTKVLHGIFHRFQPHGASGVLLIEESHLSIHTWPEAGYAAVDFYTCGGGDLQRAHAVIERGLDARSAQTLLVRRGAGALTAVPSSSDGEKLPGRPGH
jgi:S-adenosylmethionine decarboxylase proenzyme